MIKGFIIKGLTKKGSIHVKMNSRLPLTARSIIKRKVLSKDPYVVRFLFKTIRTRGQKKTIGSVIYSEESLVESLRSEMDECIEGFDYMIEVLSDE